MRQFYFAWEGATPPLAGDTVLLDAEESHHLQTVMRRHADDPVVLVDGRGHRLHGRVVGRDGRRARVEIATVDRDEAEIAPPRLRLACGVVKGRRWEWALEKAVELGAHAIVPLLTEHGVVEPRQGRRERWLGVLRAALKQSHRSWLPDLTEPAPLDAILGGDDLLFFGATPAERDGRPEAPTLPATAPPWLTVAIGPEGGWTDGERQRFLAAGALPLDLGPHVLRTETAAAASLALLQRWRGRWTDPT